MVLIDDWHQLPDEAHAAPITHKLCRTEPFTAPPSEAHALHGATAAPRLHHRSTTTLPRSRERFWHKRLNTLGLGRSEIPETVGAAAHSTACASDHTAAHPPARGPRARARHRAQHAHTCSPYGIAITVSQRTSQARPGQAMPGRAETER